MAEAAERLSGVFSCVGLHTFAPAPKDINSRSELDSQVDGMQSLLHGVSAHVRVVGGKSAVLKGRITEQIGCGHRHHKASVFERFLERRYQAVTLSGRSVDWNKIVVVQIDAIGTNFAQQINQINWRYVGPGWFTKRVTPDVSHSP